MMTTRLQANAIKKPAVNRPPPRKSEPGTGLAPPKANAVSKSAGNTPNSSPLLYRSVLHRNVTNRRNLADEARDESDTDVDVVSQNTSVNNASTELKEILSSSRQILNNGCPCQNDALKGSFLIDCKKCFQSWHPECSNLAGLTKAASKKLTHWVCPQCYVSLQNPSHDSNGDSFAEFLKVTADIRKYNEELKDSATAIDFFNAHIKHLLLSEDSYIQHSERIEKLETHVTEIKEMLQNFDQKEQVIEELSSIKKLVDMKSQTEVLAVLQEEIHDIKSALATITGNLTHENTSVATDQKLTAIQETLDSVETHGSELQKSNVALKEELEWLREVLDPNDESRDSNSKQSSILSSINSTLETMNTQLESIGDHVCPNNQNLSDEHGQAERMTNQPSPPLNPNTTSPHYMPPPEHEPFSCPPCEPYHYIDNVVSDELKTRVLGLIEQLSGDFQSVGGSRDVLYFGEYGYHYTGAYHAAKETPLEIQDLLHAVRPSLPNNNSILNSCLITRYANGSCHIPMHRDNEICIDPDSVIVTVSLGKERTIKFANASGTEHTQDLKDCSVYVMSRFSQDFWEHGIEPTDTPSHSEDSENTGNTEDTASEIRYSFTFRHIAPHFKNSLAVIGDSNIQHIKFGKKLGTLGAWAPGKRIKASKIENIPPPHEIGPYKNIIIHTGINNISDDNQRRSNNALISQLRKKCDDILSCYPNSKVHISLLFPTKSNYVNSRVNELNNLILDMTYNRKNMFILDNSYLANERGLLPEKYGRFLNYGSPNRNDIVHLGREGIRLFCKNIKKCVTYKSNGYAQSRDRFNSSRGNYGDAAARGRERFII